MNPKALPPELTQRITRDLLARQATLRAELQLPGTAGDDAGEVHDMKDLAANESQVAVHDAEQARDARELEQVAAALGRLQAGTYGRCQQCGEAIDERRLLAMPASAFCTACQGEHERHALR